MNRKLTKKEFSLKQSPWITSGILKSMKIRDKLYKSFVLEKNNPQKDQIFQKYKKYRNMVLTLTRKSKKNYYSNYFSTHNSNIKKTWEGIRELVNMNKKKSNNIKMIYENNKNITNNKDMANSFNNYYSNVGKNIEQKIPKTNTHFLSFLNFTVNSKFSFTLCSDAEIKSIISEFVSNKASGPNSIPTNLLKEFIDLFAYPIKLLVNKSLKNGIFPDMFKIAQVCPIYKKSDKSKCANYRPISLLSNLSKVFEKIMYKRLEHYLESNNLICNHQFGFRKNHSTEHALMSIAEQIKENFRKKLFTCGVFVDLEKAFDTVNHEILIAKLKHYGLNDKSLALLASYLQNRSQQVTLNGEVSDIKPISCGVPQGSILGPLLFLIYINDLHSCIKSSTVRHFADDTNLLYATDKSKPRNRNAVRNLNKDLKSLNHSLLANKISLNSTKTEIIYFRKKNKKIPFKCN